MGRDKRNERSELQWTKWIKAHRLLPAWRALSFPAREAYFHLQVRCYADSKNAVNNNGEIYRSLRKLADDMGCAQKTAGTALADLQAKGWIVCTQAWERGTSGSGKAAHFRLTMLPTAKRPATKEPELWKQGHDYPVTVYRAYLPKTYNRAGNLKKQNPPHHSGAPLHPTRAQLKVVSQ
ncbi:hypothetical protein ACSQ76_08395 [Roseovarius sp. B08]|uniref:hypothetical protein n=1 Tax=Roseovarius sp. B08 TaxID=3449223 RepID=UPI003EDC98C4